MRIEYLTKRDILKIHRRIVGDTNEDKTVLSKGNLELCVEAPTLKIYGFEPHKDLVEKACSLLVEINKLHPFAAGNKRTAYQATTMMLLNNGYVLRASRKSGVVISYGLAGCYVCFEQAVKWLRKNIRRAISY